MKLHSTLQRTLSLHFLLVAILPALVFGVIAISLLHKHLQGGIYERNRMLSHDIAAATDQFLAEVERDLQTVVRVVDARSIVSPGGIDGFLEKMVENSERFESIYLLKHEKRIVNLGLDPRMREGRGDYHDVDFSHHEIFRQHAVIDRAIWSDTFVSLVTGEPSVALALPHAEGVLLGNISLHNLSLQLSRFTMESGDSSAVVDHAGTLVASSDPAQTRQRINFSFHSVVVRTLNGSGETRLEQHDQVRLLESTTKVPRTGWVAWVGVDLGAKMMPIDHIRNLLVGIMAMALLFAASVALLDARRLMLPLSDLSRQAGEIGAGNYDVRFPPAGFVEIDNLAAGLQAMSLAVRDREQLLIDSEQRFRDLVNSIDGVVWEMEVRSGDYLFVSERSAAMFGHPPEQWLNDPGFWSAHVHPADLERVVIRGRRSLALNEKHDLEYRFMTAEKQPLWIRDLVTVVWEDDEPTRLLGVMIDISDRKSAEAELERYRIHLEELVAQRTRELQSAQNELVQKERLAILGQLTATVSHEIRNPLGTVSNALYLMRETLGSECLERAERPLVLAERGVQRCDGIISELLDFTRRRELRREPVQLDQWLSGLLDEMAWPAGVRCRRQLDSGVTVLADPERLRRAMINVINNALQAMDGKAQAERLLDISTRRLADRCEIVVKDTGSGIPEEILEKVFEPLFSTKNFGVGLGVPIIHNIMTDHGGGVDYQSRVDEGTTVTLWLPLPPAPPSSAA
ncbi:MAG: ATP-binding protein [Desulfuromonadales bacterium]